MPVTSRQKRFILEYLKDLNATKAAERAGYKHPQVQGSQLLAKPRIKAEIEHEQRGRSDRLRLDSDWIVMRLEQEASDKNNAATARIRALELLGKHLGLFQPNRVEVAYSGILFADV